jgi:hypothetical protein
VERAVVLFSGLNLENISKLRCHFQGVNQEGLKEQSHRIFYFVLDLIKLNQYSLLDH